MADNTQDTDEVIATKVQKGDSEAFGELMQRYEAKLLRYAGRFIDGEDAKDHVQDVFIKAYTNIQSFDVSRRFSPWIYRIAHNEFVNAAEKRWREKIFPFDLDLLFPQPVAPDTSDFKVRQEDMRRMLEQGLDKVPLKYKEPLILYYFDEMDYKEISDVLQIPVSTVGVRLNRGKALLRKLTEPLHRS